MCFPFFLFLNVADLSESVSAHYVSVRSSVLDWIINQAQRFLVIEPEDRMNCKPPLPKKHSNCLWGNMFLFNSHIVALYNTPFFFTIWLMLFVFGVFICFFYFLKLWNCFHRCLYTINKYITCPNPECKALKRLLRPFILTLLL